MPAALMIGHQRSMSVFRCAASADGFYLSFGKISWSMSLESVSKLSAEGFKSG
jgi:hypothetical protein